MIKIDKKIRIGALEGATIPTGLYLIRFASRNYTTSKLALDLVLTHIEKEIISYYNGRDSNVKEKLLLDVSRLRKAEIIYDRIDYFTDENSETIHYHQMVIGIDLTNDGKIPDVENNYLGSFAYVLKRQIYDYNSWEDKWITPYNSTEGFCYTFSDMKGKGNSYQFKIESNNDMQLYAQVLKIFKPYNHIAISTEIDMDKTYGFNGVAKFTFKIYDNLQEAFENKQNNTLYIHQFDGLMGPLQFFIRKDTRNGRAQFKTLYKNKPKLYWYKEMAVFYDGEKVFNNVAPYFEEWRDLGIKQLDILQFCNNKDFFFQSNIGDDYYANKLVLTFINKDKIDITHTKFRAFGSTAINATVVFKPKKDQSSIKYDVEIDTSGRNMRKYLGSFVVPVNDKDIQIDVLKIIDEAINICLTRNNVENLTLCNTSYKEHILGVKKENQPDTLSKWFESCTKVSKQNDNKLTKAYKEMKSNLEKEYKELDLYLKHYDFSKCMPVPRIVADEKMIKNYYKSLHIEPKNIIIKTINNKEIKAIEETQPMIDFMIIDNDGMILKREYPIYKFYNNKTNEVEFIYNKMKGEVTHDKTKNRR